MKTTLNQIKAKSPLHCTEGYRKLLKFLGKTISDDEVLDLSTVLKSGVIDTVWCFRAVEGYEKEKRLFAVFCAKQVQYLMTDPRSIAAIDVAERFAHGQATAEELKAARVAAYSVARDADAATYATYAAYSAAYAADSAAYAAAYSAYSDASYAADSAAYAAAADPEIKPVLEAYLKDLLSETEK